MPFHSYLLCKIVLDVYTVVHFMNVNSISIKIFERESNCCVSLSLAVLVIMVWL